ncbi:hypothetical protein KBG31_00990, partial [Patescibacteria group bacterium]|nr:hypothetical protein [Patescibacteria group bacterium]
NYGWRFSPDMRGHCADFAITFCGTYPHAHKCWLITMPAKAGAHALLFLQTTEGEWFAVNNGPPYLTKGTDFLDLYFRYPKVYRIVELPEPSQVREIGDFTYIHFLSGDFMWGE